MPEHGIHTTRATFWVHLHPVERMIYAYPVEEMRKFLVGFSVVPGRSRNGAVTGLGYLISKSAPIVRCREVPDKYLKRVDWSSLTNREAGIIHGQPAVLRMLNDRVIFPTAKRPFEQANDQLRQYDGIDFDNGEITIDLKTETYFPTDNLFVQKDERAHAVNIAPDGSTREAALPDMTMI